MRCAVKDDERVYTEQRKSGKSHEASCKAAGADDSRGRLLKKRFERSRIDAFPVRRPSVPVDSEASTGAPPSSGSVEKLTKSQKGK